MQLTLYTDYSLRVLIYLADNAEKRVTISEISKKFHISQNHLTRVVHKLGEIGMIKTIRGKGGGITLAHLPININIGKVIRDMESNFDLVECFNTEKNKCILSPFCNLKGFLYEARDSFFKVLDKKTLADLMINKNIFK